MAAFQSASIEGLVLRVAIVAVDIHGPSLGGGAATDHIRLQVVIVLCRRWS
jgi:hypothetical protein